MSQPPLLSLRDVSVGFGGRPLFRGVDLAVHTGDRLCLVGRNGSGKSTLLKVAAGLLPPDEGTRSVRADCHVAYVPQEPVVEGAGSLTDFVVDALPPASRHERYRADELLTELGLDGDRPARNLSGGEGRRAVLAATLVQRPDVLLLDEPTNHLDLPTIEWLERRLLAFRGGLVLISHDRTFLERLTRGMLWLDRGALRRNSSAGFGGFDDWAESVLAGEATSRAKFDKRLAEETRWSREGISARRTRNQGRLRRLHAMREERAEQVKRVGQVALAAERGEASGKLVIEARGLRKAYGEHVVVRDFSTTVLRGDRVGIIGPNGAGKTTLVRMLTGDLPPDAGTVRIGTRLTPVYLDQQRSKLDPDKTLWDTLVEKGTDQVLLGGKPRHVLGYLKDFLFAPEQARSPVGSLSGGERNRLLLAWAMLRPSNLLVLDEPTNDLDMETLDVLQETLAGYDGTLLLVSHDRDFLDRVVTQTIAFEPDGEIVEYAGGYSDAVTQRRSRPTAATVATPTAAPGRRARERTKLSYNEARELEALPAQIAAAEADVARLEAILEDADAYARDAKAYNAAAADLDETRVTLEGLEERWLALEELREALTQHQP